MPVGFEDGLWAGAKGAMIEVKDFWIEEEQGLETAFHVDSIVGIQSTSVQI